MKTNLKLEDDSRFRKAFLYIASRGSMDPDMGLVKINKALVFADVLALSSLGRTITHWRYLRFDAGPVPLNGHQILKEMETARQVKELSVPIGPHKLKRIVVLDPIDTKEFDPVELSLLDMGLGLVIHKNAKQVSEMSHRLPGWRWAEKDKLIDEGILRFPFLISEARLSGSALAFAVKSAEEQGLA